MLGAPRSHGGRSRRAAPWSAAFLACGAAAGCFSFRGLDETSVRIVDGHRFVQTPTSHTESALVTLSAVRDEGTGEVLITFVAIGPHSGAMRAFESTLELEGLEPVAPTEALLSLLGVTYPLPLDELELRKDNGWIGLLRLPDGVLPVVVTAKQIRELLGGLEAPAVGSVDGDGLEERSS